MGFNMKPFDLEKALVGEPVVLRSGCKAIVYYKVPDEYKFADNKSTLCPLKGLVFDINGNLASSAMYWYESGKFDCEKDHALDIVGMWEEPKLTTEEIMEKAFKESLVLRYSKLLPGHRGFSVVGKTVDNNYILQNLNNGNLYFATVFDENLEWAIES